MFCLMLRDFTALPDSTFKITCIHYDIGTNDPIYNTHVVAGPHNLDIFLGGSSSI